MPIIVASTEVGTLRRLGAVWTPGDDGWVSFFLF